MSTHDNFDSQPDLDDDVSDGRTLPQYDSEREKLLCEWWSRWRDMINHDGGEAIARQWAAAHIKEEVALPDPYAREVNECWLWIELKPGCKFVPPNSVWKRFADFSDRLSLKLKRGIGEHVGTSLPQVDKVQPVYLLDGIITTTDTVLVYGGEKEGKSTYAHKLAIVVASDDLDFDGIAVKHGRVLYVTLDPGARKTQVALRMQAICKRLDIEPPENLILVHQAVFLDDAMSVESLLRYNPGPFALVIIDPLYRALSGGDPSNAKAINDSLENIIRIRETTGAAVMILNHDTKAGGMYGSKFLGAGADCKIFVKRDFKTNKVTVRVEHSKNTGALELPPFTYRLEQEFLERLDSPARGDDEPPTVTRADMLALMPTTLTATNKARELIEHMLTAPTPKGREKEWERVRSAWEAAGLIEQKTRRLRRVTP